MTQEKISVCEAMLLITDLWEKLNLPPINTFEKCWEHQVDKHYWISLNGHKETVKNSKDIDVPPFHCYAEFNGWPFAIFSPANGEIVNGTLANEDNFIEAIKVAIKNVS